MCGVLVHEDSCCLRSPWSNNIIIVGHHSFAGTIYMYFFSQSVHSNWKQITNPNESPLDSGLNFSRISRWYNLGHKRLVRRYIAVRFWNKGSSICNSNPFQTVFGCFTNRSTRAYSGNQEPQRLYIIYKVNHSHRSDTASDRYLSSALVCFALYMYNVYYISIMISVNVLSPALFL